MVFPARVRPLPAVVQAEDGLRPGGGGVEVERPDSAGAVLGRLAPDRLAPGQVDGSRIAEAADTAQGAEIMVETTVLLHQDDHVLHVADGAGDVVGGERQGLRHARRQGGGAQRGAGRQL